MADYLPRVFHRDNDRFTDGGCSGRFILPSQPGRALDCSTRYVTEQDGRQRPPMIQFWNRFGDNSAEERSRYPDVPRAPQRAMKVFEGAASLKRWGVQIVKTYKLQVMATDIDGTLLAINSGTSHVLDQLNVYQAGTTEGRGPIANIGTVTDFIVNPATAKPYRDTNDKEMKREFFTFDINFLSAAGKVQKVAMPRIAMDRLPYDVEVVTIDSRGAEGGLFLARMDGKVVCEYRGPVGYFDMRSGAYTGIGTYRQFHSREPFGVRITGFKEETLPIAA